MDKMKKTGIFFLLFLFLGAGAALAQTRYVSDELTIMVRQGQGNQYKIIKMLKAGAPVEVLEEHEEYFLVRTEDGTEGYALKQFLTTETPKPIIIARLEKEKGRLQERIKELEGKYSDVQTQAAATRQAQAVGEGQLAQRDKELEEIRRQYQELQEQSRNVVELAAERDRLQSQNGELAAEAATLRRESEQALYSGAVKWFLAGGGVFLTGWMIGITSRKKKKGYSF